MISRLATRVVAPVLNPSTFVRPVMVRSVAVSAWGSDAWRHDKNAFKQWCRDTQIQDSRAQREFYGFCAIAFGDVDTNKDGLISSKEFDLLCEKVAALPRRYGLAPS